MIVTLRVIAFADQPTRVRCEIAAFRYRVLHAARITSAPGKSICASTRWAWAARIAAGRGRIRTAFGWELTHPSVGVKRRG